jgi:hypothetical protein
MGEMNLIRSARRMRGKMDRFGGNDSNGFGRARMPSNQPFDADRNVRTTGNSRRMCHAPRALWGGRLGLYVSVLAA